MKKFRKVIAPQHRAPGSLLEERQKEWRQQGHLRSGTNLPDTTGKYSGSPSNAPQKSSPVRRDCPSSKYPHKKCCEVCQQPFLVKSSAQEKRSCCSRKCGAKRRRSGVESYHLWLLETVEVVEFLEAQTDPVTFAEASAALNGGSGGPYNPYYRGWIGLLKSGDAKKVDKVGRFNRVALTDRGRENLKKYRDRDCQTVRVAVTRNNVSLVAALDRWLEAGGDRAQLEQLISQSPS